MENRHGLLVDLQVTQATGTAERERGARWSAACGQAATLGADKDYDTQDLRRRPRARAVTPHVAQNTRAAQRH